MARPTTPPIPRDHCAYCDAPLPLEPVPVQAAAESGAKYCCYGCRLLGESGQRPIPELKGGASGWFKVGVGAAIAGQAMLLGLGVNLAPPAGPTRWLLHLALMVSSIAVCVILGGPLLRSTCEAMREKRISIEWLFLAGIAGAFFASLVSTFTGQGAIYYEVVAVLLTVYAVGKTLGAQSRARALAESRKLREIFDACHRIAPDGQTRVVSVADIAVGDRVRTLPGEAIPVDGRVLVGAAFVRETPLTGEPFPVVRRAGDPVFAGSYSEDGELIIEASVPGHQRRLDRLLQAVDQARSIPSSTQAQADRLVRWFLPVVLAVAAGTFIFWTGHTRWTAGLFNALAVLVVACPCAMGLATPIAIWNGLAVLAARGLVAQSGNVIDRLANLTHVVFDKTGTLSEEQHSLIDLAVLGGPQERRHIVALLLAVEGESPHPIARAFQSLDETWPEASRAADAIQVRSIKTVPAQGLEAWVVQPDGQELHLRAGQREFMPDLAGEADLLATLRHSALDQNVYLAIDGKLRALAAVRERLRASTAATVATLEAMGLNCAIMTGDEAARAARLGLKKVQGGLTPAAKAASVTAQVRQGQVVAFVGDGINDAPAIHAASLGIALSHGAGVTTTNAEAVLYGGDLGVIPWAIALARQVRSSIRSNLVFAAAYNLGGIVLAAAGLLHPVVAALLMVISSFTVSWRALRSTDTSTLCCPNEAPHAAPSPQGETSALRAPSARLYSLLLLLQAPFLVYLGGLGLAASTGLTAVLAAAAWLMARFRTRSLELQHYAGMTIAMLGAGNWGMILGWWADSGFGPIPASCPHCSASVSAGLAGILAMPGMNLGMLAFGLPPMLAGARRRPRGLGPLPLGLLAATGMVLGMALGSTLGLKLVGPTLGQRFLTSLAGMTVGMLLGMFFFCEAGRALSLWWHTHSSSHKQARK